MWLDLAIGVLGSLLASFIFVWMWAQHENRTKVFVQGRKLRNVLYEAETMLSPMNIPLFRSDSFVITNPIDDEWLDRHQWFCWHMRIDEVQAEFATMYHNNFNSLSRKTVDLFRVERHTFIVGNERTVEDHFRSINSIILEAVPNNKYLGLIEYATEAGNLLKEAEARMRSLVQHANKVHEFLTHRPGGQQWHYDSQKDIIRYKDVNGVILAWTLGTRREAGEVEQVRQRIHLHREYLEGVLRGFD
jgi:hypothetical protein